MPIDREGSAGRAPRFHFLKIGDTMMLGGTPLVRVRAGAELESRWWLLPGCWPETATSPYARDDEEEELADDEDDEDDEDDDLEDDDLDDDFDDEDDLDDDLDDEDFDEADDRGDDARADE